MRSAVPSATQERWTALAFALVALALALPALISALNSVPDAGTYPGPDGRVAEVVPGSPAWRSGVRVGERVLSIEPGARAEEWVMVTERVTVRARAMVAALRETVPMAVGAVVLAAVALVSTPLRPRFAAAAAAVGVALTARPMLATGDVAWSTAAAVAALVLPGLWVAFYLRRRHRHGVPLLAVALVVACLWLWARFGDASLFDAAESARFVLTYGLAIGIVAVVLGGATLAAYGGYDARRLADVAFLGVMVGILAVAVFAAVPSGVMAIAIAVPLLAYPLARARVHAALERLVLGDLRSRASIEAVERERARLSREIHDEPLQRLAAVARRLDEWDGLAGEAAAVRSVSNQLREISVQLHPPALVELGLGAALHDLAERLEDESGIPILVDLDAGSRTGPAVRLPEDVELAAYRIAQEAMGNAVRHSGAAKIVVHARIRREALDLVVRDDGVGIDAVAAREAGPRGHLGLHSMAERAELIGASLRVEAARPGTRVTLRWPR